MRQYRRKCRLIVAGASGDGLDLSALRIAFGVKKSDAQTPNTCEMRVWNLNDTTASQIRDEFTRVTLQAGYEGNEGVIFAGNIKETRRGHERGTETILDLIAGDGDQAYNFAVVSTTLAAGSVPADQIDAAAQAMSGVARGHTADTGSRALPRGKTMFGMSRDYLRRSAADTGTTWSIQDGALQLVARDGLLPGTALRLASESGMIDTKQSPDGLVVRTLLNPLIRIGASLLIDEGGDDDGLYRVLVAEHFGDTQGQEWYTDATCLLVDQTTSKVVAQ